MYGGADRRPAAIARVRDAADVSAVVGYVREAGVPLSVRSGGHGAAAYAVVDDGIVIDVRDLRGIELDLEGRTAWAGTGLTAVEFTRAVGEHGLAVGFGDTGSVGLGGITLGGGVGYLVRKFGLTIDSLLAVELVTADGEIRIVDAGHEPDLFWAMRGAGANFGVATRFQFRLSPVPEFTGGLLILPATAEALAGFLAAADAAPEELSTIANVMPCPPMPMAPEAWHGKVVIFALMAYAGPSADATAALAPFRALAERIVDLVHPSPYVEIYPPEDPDYHPLAVARTGFIDRTDLAVATRIVDTLQAGTAPMRVAQLRVLGGASARVPANATAYAHRGRKVMVNIAAFYEGEHDREARRAWVDAFHADLTGGDLAGYVNFLDDEGEARIRAAYPHGTYDRLAALKARYDPTNLFRNNQNVLPAS
ncbi:MAG: FAD-binding oxidoreductase [Chloroflexi bacterium]|nr:FAD-binding oxidoreductase [Chloroflexota bacterium]